MITPAVVHRVYRVAESDYGNNYAAPAVAGKLVRVVYVSAGRGHAVGGAGDLAVVEPVEGGLIRANVPTSALREAAIAAIPAKPAGPPPPPIPSGPTHVPDNAAVEWAVATCRARTHMGRTPNFVGVVMAAAATAEATEGRRFYTTLTSVSSLIDLAPSTIRNYLRPLPGVVIDKGGVVLLPVRAEAEK